MLYINTHLGKCYLCTFSLWRVGVTKSHCHHMGLRWLVVVPFLVGGWTGSPHSVEVDPPLGRAGVI